MAAQSNRPFGVNNIEGLISDVGKGHTIYCKGGARAERVGAAFQLSVVLNLLTAMMPNDGESSGPFLVFTSNSWNSTGVWSATC